MEVFAAELGDRPAILTKARRNAPQGVIAIAQTLERFGFADTGYVLLDWSDVSARQEVPDSAVIPVLYIKASKRLQYEKQPWVNVEVRLDVEDIFGGSDDITATSIVEVVAEMERKMLGEIARRERESAG